MLTPDISLQVITNICNGVNAFEAASQAASQMITNGADIKEAYTTARDYAQKVQKTVLLSRKLHNSGIDKQM